MIEFYDTDSLPVTRWRNGGGETREIVSFPPRSEPFSWRASIASIAASGAFSFFPGVDRVITLLNGEGVELASPGAFDRQLALFEPFAFAGEAEVNARLSGPESLDFNIMTRRGVCRATVIATRQPQQAAAGVCWVIAGRWRVGDTTLARGQGAWWNDCAVDVRPASEEAYLLFAAIIYE
ncbi:HutD family protein [Brenneria goodwinii]|uniref:HutD/Ves family protein n=1 Tax=Brenneria goodwinii TaxID=1109412 RepID=UPI000EF1A7C1|nr:HutD family protein [Brenneria goodwinii]MCG8158340.1 HutD family protein [Brenneria goodwinii]MCG8161152.1 HutD family protein [Brenneria goodwinii]MCG8165430.1 HutD family protein [Brenneria goodwinii]MCG8169913.1 HutD family protein [Brenneria goodwinii]MCG8177115.1 HutD family protein [Brenneria goodwinii]